MVCPEYEPLRYKLFPYDMPFVSLDKLYEFMKTDDEDKIRCLAKYLYYASKVRRSRLCEDNN